MSDFNTGAFTARLDPFRTITIRHHRAEVGGKIFANVEIGELLAELARRLPTRAWPRIRPRSPEPVVGEGGDPISAEALYPRWNSFVRADDCSPEVMPGRRAMPPRTKPCWPRCMRRSAS